MICAVCVIIFQLMEAGMSGANGRSAAASVNGSGVGNATPRHPDTEARRVKGTARPLRTAQMECAPRIESFYMMLNLKVSLPPWISFIFLSPTPPTPPPVIYM
ncbi:hypothetical protein GOODEAATRI_016366 [Goodea atripinnis]|uniref:Secreted protein n=1 Tax=Goodea atripinnis TaxID=208336 RepID=A0ABV0NV30_9TELE